MKNLTNTDKKALMLSCFILVMGTKTSLAQTTTIQLPQATQCCTVADTDNDGIPDAIDNCPSVAGVYNLHGCPVPAASSGTAYSFDCDHAGTKVVDVTLSDGSVWMDRNLGALRQATDELDLFAAGCVYQYGRKPDGHQLTHFYQPRNWLNGYPTAGNVLGNAQYYTNSGLQNGFNMQPEVSNIPGGTGSGIMVESMVWSGTTPAATYNMNANSAGDLTPKTPTTSGVPARTNIGTAQGYSNFSWYSDITTYPLAATLPTLWGGDVLPNNLTPTNPYAYTPFATTPVVAWGSELNPVCPTGYHVPTAQEWLSALHSIANTDNYTAGNWGESKLHLVIGFGSDGGAYWTSSQTGGTFSVVSTHLVVGFNTDNTQHNLDPAGVYNINAKTYASGEGPYSSQCTASYYVRCKKN